MNKLSAMKAFVGVVELGGFTVAARKLDCSVATVSNMVRGLERELGVTLLARTTRQLRLTDSGSVYFDYCQRLLADVQAFESSLLRDSNVLRGRLKVDVPTAFAQSYLIPALPRFLEQYPELELILTMTGRHRDLIENDLDVAVRTSVDENSTLGARRAGTTRYLACASPALIKRHGKPSTPKGFVDIPCIGYAPELTGQVMSWRFEKAGATHVHKPKGVLTLNNPEAIVLAGIAGIGAIYLMSITVRNALAAGRLLPLLPTWQTPDQPWYVVYPNARHIPAKVRAFANFVADNFPK